MAIVKSLRKNSKDTRIFARISSADKNLIEEAAGILGQSTTAFVISEAKKAAAQLVEAQQVIRLNRVESRHLIENLLAPKKPNPRMKRALKLYRKTVASDVNPHRPATRQP